jgi:hypothetical membrane protein
MRGIDRMSGRPFGKMRSSNLVLAGVVGPIVFTTLIIVQGLLQPDYSHIAMPISALAAWPTGWIQNLNFYVMGALTIVFALSLHHRVRPTQRGRAGVALLVAGGVGVVLAGLFPWKMVDGVPTETPRHVVGAVTAFVSTGLGLIVFSRRLGADSRWRHLATYTLCSGVAVLALFVLVGFFAVDDGAPLHSWTGLLQRVLVAVWCVWMIVLAVHARVVSRAQSALGSAG